jgi:hypothetical protein
MQHTCGWPVYLNLPHNIQNIYSRLASLRERERWGDPGVDGRIMLGWIFKKWDVGVRTGLG